MNGGITYEHVAYFLAVIVALITIGGTIYAIASKSTKDLHTDHVDLKNKLAGLEKEFMHFQLRVAETYTPMAAMIQLRGEINEHFGQIREDIASLRDMIMKKGPSRG